MIKKIFTLVIIFFSLSIAQTIGPVVSVPKIDYDFSNVPAGTSVEHSFVIYNGGGALLTLSDVKSSCNCITAKLDKNKLVPGDSAHVDIVYISKGKTKPEDTYVTIKTNDPNNPNLKLFVTRAYPDNKPTLSGMPVDSSFHPAAYYPETDHDFGFIKQGQVVEYFFSIINKGNITLVIKDIKTSCGCTAAVVKKKELLPGETAKLRVQFDSAGLNGKVSRVISITTNDPKNPRKVLTILADVTK
ncbi:MAG: DUF1573 domain-containing protein [Ignavibacteriaceae bacterium]